MTYHATLLALLAATTYTLGLWAQPRPTGATIAIGTPMAAPAWATAQREVLATSEAIVARYVPAAFDAQWHQKGVILPLPPEWGVGNGPDDIPEHLRSWPLAYVLGAPESVSEAWSRFYAGHLDQYERATVPQIEMAREGIYRHGFYTSFDWEHHSEALGGFYMHSLGKPGAKEQIARARMLAGLYMNEDPLARNYDPEVRIIRSLFNGSRGPTMRPVTPVEWEGLSPSSRFAHASNVVGDHPLNMAATMLAFNAFILTGDAKYRTWALEYVDAWSDRTARNGGNIPSNVGLDGRIGGTWDGKWYGGVFGWGGEAQRNCVFRGPPEAFNAALLLSQNPKYVDVMRGQIDNLYAAKRVVDGKTLLPRLFTEVDVVTGKRKPAASWDAYGEVGRAGACVATASGVLGNLADTIVAIYMWSHRPEDFARIPMLPGDGNAQRDSALGSAWLASLQPGGDAVGYATTALQEALTVARRTAAGALPEPRVARTTAPAAPGAAGPPVRREVPGCNGVPASATATPTLQGPRRREGGAPINDGTIPIAALVNTTMGGPEPGGSTHGPLPLNVQVRHFDPERRRAGLPEDVAALVTGFDRGSVTLTLVNVGTSRPRTVTVQAGAYAEHTVTAVRTGSTRTAVDAASFDVTLAPGAGQTITLDVRRYANAPTASFPWDRR